MDDFRLLCVSVAAHLAHIADRTTPSKAAAATLAVVLAAAVIAARVGYTAEDIPTYQPQPVSPKVFDPRT